MLQTTRSHPQPTPRDLTDLVACLLDEAVPIPGLLLAGLTLGQAPVLGGPPDNPRRSPVVEVVETAGPAVVNIGAEVVSRDNPFGRRGRRDDPFWQFFGRGQRSRRSQSLGSGVIIDASGLVLTNEHVVARATAITVTLSDRRTFSAEVVGADRDFDVAVLRILDAKGLPTVALGKSESLMPGEPVVAIGNPFGLSNTVTTGVVSALHRSIEAEDRKYEDFVQTDAAINPGNSGGALLDIEGKLIGINTAIYSSGNGIGFAIPIDQAMAIVQEVLRYGEVRPAFTGVVVDPESRPGARIVGILPGSPAARAGLRKGDRLVDLGGQEIKSGLAFWKKERGLIPGRSAELTFERAGRATRARLGVEELSESVAVQLGHARLGLDVKPRRGGLVISRVDRGSAAARLGLRRGDRLLGLAGRRLQSEADFDKACARLLESKTVLAVVGRGRFSYNVPLELSLDALPRADL